MTPYYQEDGITLYCGDCREILPQLTEKFDLVLTDPPYGHNNNNGDMASRWEAIFYGRKEEYKPEEEWRPIANDGEEANELVQWFFKESFRLLEPGSCCCCCCCGGGGPDPQFARWSLWLDQAFDGGFKHMVVWDKGPMGMGHHYRRSYETILIAQKKGAACAWYDTSKSVENIIRPGMLGIKKIIPLESNHPTEKPVELMGFFIRLHSKVGDVVLDPFAGHGTTLLAAKQLNRKAVGIEISEKYCEIAVRRLAQMQIEFA